MIRTLGSKTRTAVLPAALFLALALGLAAAPAAAGPIGLQATGGWPPTAATSSSARVLASAQTITVIPNAEWLFVDKSVGQLTSTARAALPLGGERLHRRGLRLAHGRPGQRQGNTDTVFNLLAGAGLNAPA
jgi:hypothetical protein